MKSLVFIAAAVAAMCLSAPAQVKSVFHQDLNWSSDGEQISFSGLQTVTLDGKDQIVSDIYVVNVNGKGAKKVTGEERNELFSSFSPDGKLLVFGSQTRTGETSDIFSVRVDGTGLRQLTFGPGRNTMPSFSPNGRQVAFVSNREGGTQQIFVMDAEGTNLVRVTSRNDLNYYNPQWSPEGTLLVFYSIGDEGQKIWTAFPDGSFKEQLRLYSDRNVNPSFSPDGKRIVFSTDLDGEDGGIFTMNTDGGDLQQIEGVRSTWARISPDGKKIAWIEGSYPRTSIYVSNLDGTGKMNIGAERQ